MLSRTRRLRKRCAACLASTPGTIARTSSLGFRGLGRLGSYGNRVLVLFDGHPANDNWIGSSYVGYDSRTDLADVERIEVVRGPGSVLYGTNAFSGVINVVTRQRDVRARGRARRFHCGLRRRARQGPRGCATRPRRRRCGRRSPRHTAKAATSSSRSWWPRHRRRSPATRAASTASGPARSPGRATWRYVTAQWFLHSFSKQLPTAVYETLLADPRTRQTDTRGFVEARVEPQAKPRSAASDARAPEPLSLSRALSARSGRRRAGGRHLPTAAGRDSSSASC